MARKVQLNLGSTSIHSGFATSFALVLSVIVGVCSNQVQVPERVSAVLGKNITLGCRVEVGSNLSLTQISWERRMPSGIVTLAVFNPVFGISVSDDYRKRVSFLQPSAQDASIILQGVAFADVGLYTCKVATFPLGNTQASTTLDIMVEPKVYVSAGARVLLDGGAEVVVATCTAERGRPAAEVLWESELPGHSEPHSQDEPNGTTTTMVRYTWAPTRLAQGRPITCVVHHPALPTEFRIPYVLDVQFAPDVTVAGYNGDWIVGQANRRLECRANANPAASHFIWTRLDGQMSEGVEVINGSLLFVRPLERNDSGIYRCEAQNDIGMRSYDLSIWIHEPPPTTAVSTATAAASPGGSFTSAPPNNRRAHFTSPTLPPPAESSLGTVVGGAVGGVLFLLLLLILGGVCYMRQRRTFRGDYYTKQYMGHSDMQKEAQLDVLQPHELKDVFGDKGSQDLKPKPDGDIIYPIDYPGDRGDGEWGDSLRLQNDGGYYPEPHSPHSTKPGGTPSHSPTLNNGSPYLREDCYDNGGDGDYVAHVDGSVISRREWYV